jgi:hypothetical protein
LFFNNLIITLIKYSIGLPVNGKYKVDIQIPPPLTIEEKELVMKNIEYCIVGIIDNWEETKEVMNLWYVINNCINIYFN